MNDKIKVVIGIVLVFFAIIFYLVSQVSTSLENVGTNLLFIFLAMVLANFFY
ncbi:MAG TPA: hypothetical protein PLC38_03865 [Methanobacterium sp.]|jgi:hypothetical protein|nr:hypothetical protein [Methanobacterium sp.]